jgi:aspartate aminotransferase-like enzyme/GNAT superfamily N-acetyltransferase
MSAEATLVYKPATEPWELEQIHRLNYATFVEEIPQHAANGARRLVDRFDGENTYFVCRRGERVLGMIAVRGARPWSLDAKLPDVDRHLPDGRRFCEIRLLAIDAEHRGGPILRGLMSEVMSYALRHDFTGAVISGTVRQRRLYEHLGFVPFGPLVGSGDALYQPMYITVDALRDLRVPFEPGRAARAEGAPGAPVSFLPGPVDLHPDVLAALAAPPISHREDAFVARLDALRQTLCALVGATHAEVLVGTGTLANDVVAAQLAAVAGVGVVLSNGEFGERLVDHAARAGLACAVERVPWGAPLDADAIDGALARHPSARWAWMVHLETSTGVLNDVPHLASLARARGMVVAADCVSAVGSVPVAAGALDFATAVSGKGLGSVPGLAVVFHRGGALPQRRLPRYLDLALYASERSAPFTHSSNLVLALEVAARRTLLRGRLADVARLGAWLRGELRARGLAVVAPDRSAAPSVVTVALDADERAGVVGDALRARGHLLSYRSAYLRERNWIQVALMGECSRAKLRRLLADWDDLRQSRANT